MASLPSDLFAVGLTGGIGSGKSTIAALFAEHGIAVIDADSIAHTLTAPNGAAMPAIHAHFGAAFIAPDGSLNRPKMRERIFADDDAKAALEAIIHPLIRVERDRLAQSIRSPYSLFVVPLLVECADWQTDFDRIIVIDCAKDTQLARVMMRNQFTRAQVLAIVSRQATRAQRLARADDVIINEGKSIAQLSIEVDALHARYLDLAKRRMRNPRHC